MDLERGNWNDCGFPRTDQYLPKVSSKSLQSPVEHTNVFFFDEDACQPPLPKFDLSCPYQSGQREDGDLVLNLLSPCSDKSDWTNDTAATPTSSNQLSLPALPVGSQDELPELESQSPTCKSYGSAGIEGKFDKFMSISPVWSIRAKSTPIRCNSEETLRSILPPCAITLAYPYTQKMGETLSEVKEKSKSDTNLFWYCKLGKDRNVKRYSHSTSAVHKSGKSTNF